MTQNNHYTIRENFHGQDEKDNTDLLLPMRNVSMLGMAHKNKHILLFFFNNLHFINK